MESDVLWLGAVCFFGSFAVTLLLCMAGRS